MSNTNARPARLCDLHGCHRPAEWHPVLLIHGPAGRAVERLLIGVAICDTHRKCTRPEDLVTETNRKKLREMGRVMARCRAEEVGFGIDFVRLASPEALALARGGNSRACTFGEVAAVG